MKVKKNVKMNFQNVKESKKKQNNHEMDFENHIFKCNLTQAILYPSSNGIPLRVFLSKYIALSIVSKLLNNFSWLDGTPPFFLQLFYSRQHHCLTIKTKYKKLSNLTLTEMKQKHNQTQKFYTEI